MSEFQLILPRHPLFWIYFCRPWTCLHIINPALKDQTEQHRINENPYSFISTISSFFTNSASKINSEGRSNYLHNIHTAAYPHKSTYLVVDQSLKFVAIYQNFISLLVHLYFKICIKWLSSQSSFNWSSHSFIKFLMILNCILRSNRSWYWEKQMTRKLPQTYFAFQC